MPTYYSCWRREEYIEKGRKEGTQPRFKNWPFLKVFHTECWEPRRKTQIPSLRTEALSKENWTCPHKATKSGEGNEAILMHKAARRNLEITYVPYAESFPGNYNDNGRAKESGNRARIRRRGTYKKITKGRGDKIRRVV